LTSTEQKYLINSYDSIFKDQYSFENFYGERLKEVFDKTILETLQVFNSSPLRITKPRFEPLREGFFVYAGLVNYAPAKCKFI